MKTFKIDSNKIIHREEVDKFINEAYEIIKNHHPIVVDTYNTYSSNQGETIIKDQIFLEILNKREYNPVTIFEGWMKNSSARSFMRAFGYETYKPITTQSLYEETGEYKNSFKVGMKIRYKNKDWTVVNKTKDWVELADKRGLNTIVDYDDIKSFIGNKLVSESSEEKMQKILNAPKTSNRILEVSGIKSQNILQEKQVIPAVLKVLKSKETIAIGIVLYKFFQSNMRIVEDGLIIRISPEHAIYFHVESGLLRISWYKGRIPKGKFNRADVIEAIKQFMKRWDKTPVSETSKEHSEFVIDVRKLSDKIKDAKNKVGNAVKKPFGKKNNEETD